MSRSKSSKVTNSTSKSSSSSNNNNNSNSNSNNDNNIDSLRNERLNIVFNKALDVSMNSIGEDILDECFGDIKSKYKLGNDMNKSFINMCGETHSSIGAAYKDICNKKQMEEKLKILETTPINNIENESKDALNGVIIDLKKVEMDNIIAAINHIEGEMSQLKDTAEKLKTNMKGEIAAASEEGHKLALAVSQF